METDQASVGASRSIGARQVLSWPPIRASGTDVMVLAGLIGEGHIICLGVGHLPADAC